MKDLNKLMKIYSNDRPLLGALQELAQRRESVDIKSAKKFLGNSEFKQLLHITSELWECWKAWILWKIGKGRRYDLALELIDLQGSCQTMQEGALGYTKDVINLFRWEVILKNAKRGYDKTQQKKNTGDGKLMAWR